MAHDARRAYGFGARSAVTVSVQPARRLEVATPDEVSAVREVISDARASRTALRIAGRGLWLDAGRPVEAERVLRLSGLSGIVDYVPGDLTLTARAGTPLADLMRATAAEKQWLGLDPPGPTDGTIGATVATASVGPLAHGYGTMRDLVLGFEAVSGAGDVIRAGGRVVKNVAGFDLTRLFTGAWGTLGAITEVTIRLRAIPEVDESYALLLRDGRAVEGLVPLMLERGLSALALELVDGAVAARLGLPGAALLVRLSGNEPLVRAQASLVAKYGSTVAVDSSFWDALRTLDSNGGTVARVSARPSVVPLLWRSVLEAAAHGGAMCHASLARGIARVIAPPGDEHTSTMAASLSAASWKVIWERAPRDLWGAVDPDPVRARLARDARRAFDPDGVLNPGLLGGDE